MNKIQLDFYLARDENGSLYLFTKAPKKGAGMWVYKSGECCLIKLDNNLHPEIKWEDEEPTKITLREV